jgi:hypothetical protein
MSDVSNNSLSDLDISSNIVLDSSSQLIEISPIEKFLDEIQGITTIQKKYILDIYSGTKKTIEDLSKDITDNTILITKILIETIKIVEKIKVSKCELLGIDKKMITISIGKIYLKEKFPDNLDILIIYNVIADPLIDQMVHLSKNINIGKPNGLLSCCFKQ